MIQSIREPKKKSEDLLHQLEDEPLDLLDQKKRLALRSGGKRKLDSDDGSEFDEEERQAPMLADL